MKSRLVAILLAAALLALGLSLSAQAGDDPEPMAFEAPEDGLEINHIQGHSDQDLGRGVQPFQPRIL